MSNNWRSLASMFGRRKKSLEAQLTIVNAYQAVFRGNPSRDQQEMVLADLLNVSGFNKVCPADTSDTVLRQSEGKRELYAHIFSKLTMSDADKAALEVAARHDAAADQQPQHDY